MSKLANTKNFTYVRTQGRIEGPMSLVCPEPSIIPVCVHVIHAGVEYEFAKKQIMRLGDQVAYVDYYSHVLEWTMRLFPEGAPTIYQPHQFTAEERPGGHTDYTAMASDIGWRPGEWPESLWLETVPGSFINFSNTGAVVSNGDLKFVMYYSMNQDGLFVYND